jgi:hypothetical protein
MPDSATTAAHADKSTLVVSINVPEHAQRKASPTFERTCPLLIQREGDRCYICGRTSTEVGAGHEAHHCMVEWCLADAIDWNIVKALCQDGEFGESALQRAAAKAFDWSGWDLDAPTPAQIESLVDDMTVNGQLLCKEHHTGNGTGKHNMDHPRWIGQKLVKPGYVLINGDAMGTEAEILQEVEAEEGVGVG